jgi:hypothetical protein
LTSTMKRVLAYVIGTVTSPRQGFTMILFDAQGLSTSVLLLFTAAIVWALATLGWAIASLQPWMTPWLSIPPEEYYLWQTVLTIPVLFAGWILASGFVQLTSHRIGGGGSFDATARLLALSIAIPKLVLAIPVLVLAVLVSAGALNASTWLQNLDQGGPATGIVALLLSAEAVWTGILTSFAVRAAHKLRARRSVLVAIPTVLVYYGFVLVFLR